MNKTCWIDVKYATPTENETVWLYNINTGYITLGCYIYVTNEGWFWAESNGVIYNHNNEIITEAELTDLDITHWHPVPKLLKKE
jgi:hypothetical protein